MTEKRFTSMYNEQSDMIQYVDTLKEEPNKWSICNVSGTLKKLNELHEENQIKLEIVDAFIRGLEDEKGIDSENKEFQCRMNHTIKVLKKLKEEMLDPTDFKRAKELRE